MAPLRAYVFSQISVLFFGGVGGWGGECFHPRNKAPAAWQNLSTLTGGKHAKRKTRKNKICFTKSFSYIQNSFLPSCERGFGKLQAPARMQMIPQDIRCMRNCLNEHTFTAQRSQSYKATQWKETQLFKSFTRRRMNTIHAAKSCQDCQTALTRSFESRVVRGHTAVQDQRVKLHCLSTDL